MHSPTAVCVAQDEASEAREMPAGKVQLLIVPSSLTMSKQRAMPPAAQGMSAHSSVNIMTRMPLRRPA